MKNTCETLVRQVVITRGDFPGSTADRAADIARASVEGFRASLHRHGHYWTAPWIADGMKILVLEVPDEDTLRHIWFDALKESVPVGPIRYEQHGGLNALAIGPAPADLVRGLSQGFPVMGLVDDA